MADEQTAPAQGKAEATLEVGEFSTLLDKQFRPKSDRIKTEIDRAVATLAEEALRNTRLISDDALTSIQSLIAAIDAKLTEQVNLILHHDNFQKLESAWRGLHY